MFTIFKFISCFKLFVKKIRVFLKSSLYAKFLFLRSTHLRFSNTFKTRTTFENYLLQDTTDPGHMKKKKCPIPLNTPMHSQLQFAHAADASLH